MRYNTEELEYKRKKLIQKRRKRFIRRFFRLLLITIMLPILIVVGTVYYAIKIEPYRVVTEKIEIGNIDNTESIKIVQFSDTHIKEDFTYKNLSKVVDEINKSNADIVIFTGDLYDDYSVYKDDENIINELSKIHKNIAKIAIWGNRDLGGGAVTQYQNIMEASGFEVLKNESKIFTVKGKNIQISAIDDSLLGNPVMPTIGTSENIDYNIFLTHEPDVIENYNIDGQELILAGHTHGGQVDIPFLPFINDAILNTTEFSTNYESGVNILNAESNQMLYVNRGIGTTRLSIRLGVVPEVTEFSIYLDN